MSKKEEQLSVNTQSDIETDQVVSEEDIGEETSGSEIIEEEIAESDTIEEEVIPEAEEEISTDQETEQEVVEEEIVEESKEEKSKEEVKPEKESPSLDIDKSLFPQVEVYTDEQYKEDYRKAFESGDVNKMAFFTAKLTESKATEKARYLEQVTSLKAQIKDVEEKYPEESKKFMGAFINWLKNPNITMEDNFELFLRKTGKMEGKTKTQTADTLSKTMGRIKKNLAKKGSLTSVRGNVKRKPNIEKSKEQLEAEKDTGEDFSVF